MEKDVADAAHEFQIVMEKVAEDRQPDAAMYLSGCFSLPPASTKGMAASGPIALLSDLGEAQAEAIVKELAASAPAGVVLRVAGPDEKNKVSRLQWPRPPRIYGSKLDEFVPREAPVQKSKEIVCPHCGERIELTQDADGVRAVAAGDEKSDTDGKAAARRGGETAFYRAPTPADKDPLFSGVKPLNAETVKYASMRSLQAGDTGFWMDYSQNVFSPPPPPEEGKPVRHGGTSTAKKSTGKISAGLAAFMKSGSYAVVVGRTRDSQTVKMIAEIMGISENEARERALDLGLCVARDISLDEAQTLLTRFRNLGTKARIVRPS